MLIKFMIKIFSILLFLLTIILNSTDIYSQIDLKLNDNKKTTFEKLKNYDDESKKLRSESNKLSLKYTNQPEKFNSENYFDTTKYHRFYPKYNKRESLMIPIYESAGMNIGLALFNNYVGGASFAKITFKSVKHNLDTGFVWDDDVFVVNQFGHPFHGSIYFNTARSTGFSYWESVPFAFGGSLMWEMFMETDPPQTNDIIQTTFGGVMVGEMTYRLTSLILDESTRGANRTMREVVSAILNPARGFNRLVSGDMFRHTPTNVNDVFPVTSRLNVGYAGISASETVNFDKNHFMLEYLLVYGNNVGRDKEYKPFEFFRLRAGFDAAKADAPSTWIHAYGLIYGKNILNKKNDDVLVFGVFHDYDYNYNNIIQLGTQSVGLGLIYDTPEKRKFRMVGTFHSNFVVMGAINSIYQKGPFRNYDYTIGNKTMLEFGIYFKPVSLILDYKFYYLYTVNGFPGHANFGILNPKLLVDIYKGFGIGTEYVYYHRHGTFEGVADYNKSISEFKIYGSYLF